MKKVLITGATSGIGEGLAREFINRGYLVSGVGRREERLEEIQKELGSNFIFQALDVTDHETAEKVYDQLIEEMGGLDIIILNAGVGRDKMMGKWEIDHQTIDVNVMAFAHGCHYIFFNHFLKQGYGQIVGISSLASHLAHHGATSYTASKHFISNYMTGYRQKVKRVDADITITDIRPGFVQSEMISEHINYPWMATTEKACMQIVNAIEKKKNRAYITKRWWLVALVARLIPEWLWDRI